MPKCSFSLIYHIYECLQVSSLPSQQPNAMKCLADLEEYLEEVSPVSICTTTGGSTSSGNGSTQQQPRSSSLPLSAEISTEDAQFWYDIRQKMLEIVELTCQTQNFNQCCSGAGDKTSRLRYGCPFESGTAKKSTQVQPFHHSRSAVNMRSSSSGYPPSSSNNIDKSKLYMRRGSSPVTSTRSPLLPSMGRRDPSLPNVSYGGFESIVSSFNDSAFTFEDDQEEIWSSTESGNQFRRDLHIPVRRKKHHSSFPCVSNGAHSELLSVQELMY